MDFDPYSQWLEIPADRRPPTYYDLLGLPAFEPDAGRIRQSALERTNRVRRYQLGQHGQAAFQLLSEISLAFDTLTRSDRKQEYDRHLAGMATEDRSFAETTIVADPPREPPAELPTSPFQAGFVPTPDPASAAAPRQRRSLARGIAWSLRGLLSAAVSSLMYGVKAALWSVRLADRAMCKSVGDENAILHNFFRVAAAGGLVGCIAACIWFWPMIGGWLLPSPVAELASSPVEQPPAVMPNELSQELASSSPREIEPKEQQPPGTNAQPAGQLQLAITPPVQPVQVSTFSNSLGMQMARIPAGQFTMGSPAEEVGRVGGEHQHWVQLGKEFCLGVHEVTQADFQQVMGAAASPRPRDPNVPPSDAGRMPANSVLWAEAVQFCQKLSARPEEQAAGRRYRLPTEAEWEYACRAGTTTAWNTGAALTSQEANINSGVVRPKVIGLYRPNAWGLFDMHGNVEEWCADFYDYSYYRNSATLDPTGPAAGLNRVCRGGSYLDTPEDCRSARRVGRYPASRMIVAGFRVACDLINK